MSTVTVTNIRRTGETAVRSTRGIATAWANINGTGTAAIRDSENTSSVTDGGAGIFTQNFINAMANSDYCVATAQGTFANGDTIPITQTTTTSQLNTYNTSTLTDAGIVMAATHGDLA